MPENDNNVHRALGRLETHMENTNTTLARIEEGVSAAKKEAYRANRRLDKMGWFSAGVAAITAFFVKILTWNWG